MPKVELEAPGHPPPLSNAVVNGGFFVLPVWGAYTWKGLFSELYGNLNNNEKHAKAMGTLETPSNFFSNFAITSPDS